MDETEALAHEYLSSLRLGTIEYEPDGNQPPDFLVAGRIAVEVRRLNRSLGSGDKRKGLETDQFALERLIRKLLESLGGPINGLSWFVTYRFRRPIPSFPEIDRAARAYLLHFSKHPFAEREMQIAKNFWIPWCRQKGRGTELSCSVVLSTTIQLVG
jgi:hypothetical protein